MGHCSRKLQQEFPELNKQYWGRLFWAIGFSCWTTGNITDEMVNDYLEHHRRPKFDTIKPSELKLSRNNLLNILSSDELKQQLPEYLGELNTEANLVIDNENGYHIGITPFARDNETPDLIMSSKKHEGWRHVLIEKNKLNEYYN